MTKIGGEAFSGCGSLQELSIQVNSSLQIDGGLLNYSNNFNALRMYGETLPASAGNLGVNYNTATLYVPSELYDQYRSTSPWSNFVHIEKNPNAIYLTDGEEYTRNSDVEDINIVYTRTFNNTAWQALYIPFSMSYDDWKDDFDVAYINGIRQLDTDNDNVIDETIMDVYKIVEGSLIPSTPYLIKAKTTGEKTISVSGTTLYKAEEKYIDCSTTIAKYIFTGTYSTIPAETMYDNNYYAMGGGSLILTDGESDLKPYRWYLNVEARSPMYNLSNSAKTIMVKVLGEENETTGVHELQTTNEELPVYDINGRKVNGNALKPGMYINNGKKVIIK